MKIRRTVFLAIPGLLIGTACLTPGPGAVVWAQAAPTFHYDPTWPNPLPNLWKLGGVTGLAVDSNDDVWVYNRPNDAVAVERRAEPGTDIAVCCVRPPSMIHIDKHGNVIGAFDAPQGHGMAVDAEGFVYLGQDTVRKYDPATGEIVAEVAKTPNKEPREDSAAIAAFRSQHPPETPMIVGGLEEIRIIEEDGEMYVADNYLGGRVLVFDLDTFAFKRGWGAYGRPLSEISLDDADHAYTPNGPMARDFVGHLTVNVSNDGLVYAADRRGNRIHVTTKQGDFLKEFILAPDTGAGGSTSVASSAGPCAGISSWAKPVRDATGGRADATSSATASAIRIDREWLAFSGMDLVVAFILQKTFDARS